MAESTTYADLRLAVQPLRDGARSRDSIQTPVWHRLLCSPLPAPVQRGIVLFLGVAVGLAIYSCCLLADQGWRIGTMERALERTNEALNNWEKLMSGELQFCMAGWHWEDGKCYYFSTSANNWEKSKEDCRSRDASLVMMKDNKSMDFIKQLSYETQFLIGLKKDRNIWKWQDGTKLEEYHQVKRTSTQSRICAKIASGELSDEACHASQPWICQKEAFTLQAVRVSPPPAVLHFGGVRYIGGNMESGDERCSTC